MMNFGAVKFEGEMEIWSDGAMESMGEESGYLIQVLASSKQQAPNHKYPEQSLLFTIEH